MPTPLTESDLDEIEAEAMTNAAETYRGALLALVAEVRRLRGLLLAPQHEGLAIAGCWALASSMLPNLPNAWRRMTCCS